MRRRVVITGMGAVTPLGHAVDTLYQAQIEGKSGVGPIRLFDASRFPTRIAGQVKNFDLAKYVPDPKAWENSGVNSRFAVGAAQQALKDAGLIDDSKTDRTRIGVYLGSGEGIQDFHHLVWLIAQHYQPQSRSMDTVAFAQGRCGSSIAEREYGAGAAHDAGSSGRSLRSGRPELQLPDRLRRQQPGHRRGDRNDPPRRRRHDALRRLAQHDPPVRRHRLQPADRPVDAQRRSRRRRRGRSTSTAMASCWAKAPACWCSKSSSTPRARGATSMRS